MDFLKKYWKTILIFGLLLVIFVTNAFHEKYPDEFDSIVGGRYITEGRLPYRDWFQHHQPGAYVAASILLPFTGHSFVKFRIAWEIAIYALLVGSYVWLKMRMPKHDLSFYVVLLFVLGLSATYFWGHMLLADTLAGYLMLPAFAMVSLSEYYRERFELRDLAVTGLFLFLSWFTSMTYIIVVAVISAYALYLYTTRNPGRRLVKHIAGGVFVLAVPYVLFGIYLVLTGSLADYYWANVIYNTNYYIYNYPHAPGQPINPIRYSVVIANTFINNYLPALWGVAGFPISNPVQVTLAFSSAAAVALAVVTKRWLFLVPLIVTMVFSNARSNPQSIRETDYQAFVYIITSMFNGLFSLYIARDLLNESKIMSRKIGLGVLYITLLLYWIATPLYFAMKMEQKFYPKYMGEAPLIYSRPEIAHYVNALVNADDYVYIGPFEFEELFYLNARQPSKHHWFLDHAAKNKIKDELIADLNKNRPKVIVFQRNFAPWGGDPKTYNWWMTEFLDREYFRIFTLGGYRWTIGKTQNFDLDGTFNFDKRYQQEILDKLLSLGYIEPITSK